MKQNNILLVIIIRVLAVSGLFLTLIPAIMFFYGQFSENELKWWMGSGMVLWFLTGSLWLGRKTSST